MQTIKGDVAFWYFCRRNDSCNGHAQYFVARTSTAVATQIYRVSMIEFSFEKCHLFQHYGNKFSNYKRSNTKYEQIEIQTYVQVDKNPVLFF